MSRNYFIMRQQLKDFGIELSDNASDSEIKEKFYKELELEVIIL